MGCFRVVIEDAVDGGETQHRDISNVTALCCTDEMHVQRQTHKRENNIRGILSSTPPDLLQTLQNKRTCIDAALL